MRLIDKEYDFFVLEIGTEELPKDAIHLAKVQCETAFSKLLDSNRLDWRGNILCGVTPRRIVLMIPELATWQSPQTKKLRGPPAKIAYKESGEATEALLGFCRTQGVSVSSVTVEHDKNSDYVFATKYESGSSTIEVMTEMLPPFLHSLTFARTMKWNDTLVNFPRPIRWLFAMLGEETIRFHYAGLRQPIVLLAKTNFYMGTSIGHCNGFKWKVIPKRQRSRSFLRHQRYFPVQSVENDELLPFFIFVTQLRKDMELVRKGNESVLRARYTDAEFFYRHDLMQSFDSFRQKLQGLTFQESLGSMLDKNIRLERMVSILHDQLQLTPEESRDLRTAAQLCKVDLASSMLLPLKSITYLVTMETSYRRPGLELFFRIIDRVDSLVGLFAAGCLPRASADPFGLRRTALGLVQVCVLHEMDVNLRHYFEIAAKLQPIAVPCQVIDQALSFVMKRLETWLTEDEATWDIANHEADVIQAVLAEQSSGNPFQIAYARPAKLLLSVVTKDWSEIPEIPDPTLFETEDENGLYYIISKDYEAMNHYANNNLSQILETLARWKPFIDTFFENVFVMSSDYRIRYNRIALCRMITKITTGIIDLTKLLFETQVFHCGAVH
ncbi:Glycine--tRNA ligase, chloroplastic/mitochondrial 2 [Galdieria sulphuraria]|nr:Glycine--tRNA ligase, chloroplastic/mitochondrial 2 [Galdieria sulphuraria]